MNRVSHRILNRLTMVLFSLVVFAPVGYSLQVTDLYSHQIQIANESETERERAFSEALAAVILKITGERRWLDDPAIRTAVRNAGNYVEAISYSVETILLPVEESQNTDNSADAAIEVVQTEETDPQSADAVPTTLTSTPSPASIPDADNVQDSGAATIEAVATSVEQRYINVDFASALIDELLASLNIPLWDSNRPSVLVWMVLQDEEGNRSFMTADSRPEIVAYMQSFAAERALPIIFPVLDFEDRQNLSEDIVWNLDEEALLAASVRYGADSVLSGRMLTTPNQELVGLWQFIFQEEVQVFDGFDTDLETYISSPLERITSQLASYFAILPEQANQQSVTLRVEGIKDLSSYSALLSYVANLGLVESVAPAALDGERLELDIGLLGDVQQLHELIALDRDLRIIESSRGNEESLLHYRWTR